MIDSNMFMTDAQVDSVYGSKLATSAAEHRARCRAVAEFMLAAYLGSEEHQDTLNPTAAALDRVTASIDRVLDRIDAAWVVVDRLLADDDETGDAKEVGR